MQVAIMNAETANIVIFKLPSHLKTDFDREDYVRFELGGADEMYIMAHNIYVNDQRF